MIVAVNTDAQDLKMSKAEQNSDRNESYKRSWRGRNLILAQQQMSLLMRRKLHSRKQYGFIAYMGDILEQVLHMLSQAAREMNI